MQIMGGAGDGTRAFNHLAAVESGKGILQPSNQGRSSCSGRIRERRCLRLPLAVNVKQGEETKGSQWVDNYSEETTELIASCD